MTKFFYSMAKSQNPLTGKMSGAMGNFVTSSLGSHNIVRAKAFNPRDAKTEAQQKQRGGFKMMGELFPLFGGILIEGFSERSANSQVYSAFMAANLPNAVDKSGESAAIDFSKVKVSDGSLPIPVIQSAILTENGITISINTQLKNQLNSSTDELVALVLLKSGELWIERQLRGENLTQSILIPVEGIVAEEIQGTYLFAKRANSNKVSKSVFVGI